MREVGIRELKQHTSEVVRRVREEKETVLITYRGKAVARLEPIEDESVKRAEDWAIWAEMDELAKEFSAHWPAGVSAVEAVREQRG